MMNKEINEKLIEFELDIKNNFIERHMSELTNKAPEEIIEAYIKWRHNRYTVIEDEDFFVVVDMYSQDIPVAMINKGKDPDGFNHAWAIAEGLNDLPDQFVSIGNKVMAIDNFDVEFEENYKPDPLKTIAKMPGELSISEALDAARKFIDDEEE